MSTAGKTITVVLAFFIALVIAGFSFWASVEAETSGTGSRAHGAPSVIER